MPCRLRVALVKGAGDVAGRAPELLTGLWTPARYTLPSRAFSSVLGMHRKSAGIAGSPALRPLSALRERFAREPTTRVAVSVVSVTPFALAVRRGLSADFFHHYHYRYRDEDHQRENSSGYLV